MGICRSVSHVIAYCFEDYKFALNLAVFIEIVPIHDMSTQQFAGHECVVPENGPSFWGKNGSGATTKFALFRNGFMSNYTWQGNILSPLVI